MRVDAAVVSLELVAKGALHELLARKDLSGMRSDRMEYLKLGRCELNLFAPDTGLVALPVNDEVAIIETHGPSAFGLALLSPSEHRLDPRHELARAKGLNHVVVSAEGEAGYALLLGVFRRKHDYREVAHLL